MKENKIIRTKINTHKNKTFFYIIFTMSKKGGKGKGKGKGGGKINI